MGYPLNSVYAKDTMVRELLKPLLPFLKLDGVTELVVNRPGEFFLEVRGKFVRHELPELSLTNCLSLANAIATYTEQQISPANPILSAMLPEGERIQIVVPSAVEHDTISFSIRRPSSQIKSLDEYAADGAFSNFLWPKNPALDRRKKDLEPFDKQLADMLLAGDLKAFIEAAVAGKKNIAVVGDTGSGKTTLMKSACQSIPNHERLITIEDVRELFLPHHENRVHLLYSKGGQGVAKVTPADLIASTMRMKPDRVLLAELRGGEAFDFLKLLTTGHSGSITSFHAESCALATERYVFMCKEHRDAATYDEAALKRLVAMTIDVIIHVVAEKQFDGDGRMIGVKRYVKAIHFDPVAKLQAQFGDADLIRPAK